MNGYDHIIAAAFRVAGYSGALASLTAPILGLDPTQHGATAFAIGWMTAAIYNLAVRIGDQLEARR